MINKKITRICTILFTLGIAFSLYNDFFNPFNIPLIFLYILWLVLDFKLTDV